MASPCRDGHRGLGWTLWPSEADGQGIAFEPDREERADGRGEGQRRQEAVRDGQW
jgi:hypothetical protein